MSLTTTLLVKISGYINTFARIGRNSKWVNRIEESFSGDFSSTHTTYERNYRTAVMF